MGTTRADAVSMTIKQWPTSERPREKLLAQGASSLSDAELLAVFLGSGTRGNDAVSTARALLVSHGPLRTLLDRPPQAMMRLPGLGPARSCALLAGLEMAQRHLAQRLKEGDAIADSPTAAGHYLQRRIRGQSREVFCALFLDNRHRMLACEDLFHGTINTAVVHPREVVRRALELNAAAVIVAHNHPSGDPEPSQADCRLTCTLQQALALVDIRLLDHFVIGEGRPVSFAERGLLQPASAS